MRLCVCDNWGFPFLFLAAIYSSRISTRCSQLRFLICFSFQVCRHWEVKSSWCFRWSRHRSKNKWFTRGHLFFGSVCAWVNRSWQWAERKCWRYWKEMRYTMRKGQWRTWSAWILIQPDLTASCSPTEMVYIVYHIYPEYWDTLTPYHNCHKIWKSLFYCRLMCLK